MNKNLLSAFLVISSLAVCSTSRAQLLGDTISATGFGLTPSSATIGAGNEFTALLNFGAMGFDFGANTLTLDPSFELQNWSGSVGSFTFSGFDVTITGITVASNTALIAGITPSFNGSQLTLDFSTGGVVGSTAGTLVYNIQTASSVPDAGATALFFGMALVSVLGVRCWSRL